MLRKLKSRQAETLLETLVSILIAVLSVTLLTTSVMASARMNSETEEADREYNENLKAAETFSGTKTSGEVRFVFTDASLNASISVDYYGEGEFASYKKTP